jgi:hypothetical protein
MKDDAEQLRQKALADAEQFAEKQRFALFSYKPPLFLGEGESKPRKLRN